MLRSCHCNPRSFAIVTQDLFVLLLLFAKQKMLGVAIVTQDLFVLLLLFAKQKITSSTRSLKYGFGLFVSRLCVLGLDC